MGDNLKQMTKIEITDPVEIEQYKNFIKYQAELNQEQKQWKELRTFTKQLGFGSFTLVVKDGLPHRVDNPMQTIVLGIKL